MSVIELPYPHPSPFNLWVSYKQITGIAGTQEQCGMWHREDNPLNQSSTFQKLSSQQYAMFPGIVDIFAVIHTILDAVLRVPWFSGALFSGKGCSGEEETRKIPCSCASCQHQPQICQPSSQDIQSYPVLIWCSLFNYEGLLPVFSTTFIPPVLPGFDEEVE